MRCVRRILCRNLGNHMPMPAGEAAVDAVVADGGPGKGDQEKGRDSLIRAVTERTKDRIVYNEQVSPRGRTIVVNSRVAVLFLVGHEHLNHHVPRAGEAVPAAGGDGSTQLVERQRGAENLDSFAQPRITAKTFREPTRWLLPTPRPTFV